MKKFNTSVGSTVTYSSDELLFLAHSGQPYRGSVYVHFTTGDKVVDLIDFKKFLTSLRHETLTSESIAKHIYDWFEDMIDLTVTCYLTPRGGIRQTITHGKPHVFEKTTNQVFTI